MGNKFSPELPIISLSFFVNISLMIPIYLKRRQNEKFDQLHGGPKVSHQIPNSIESLIWNLVIIGVCLSGIVVIEMNNR